MFCTSGKIVFEAFFAKDVIDIVEISNVETKIRTVKFKMFFSFY